ncbi:adenylate kinase family enzyme [Pseudomonas sp. BIGb0408]|uniref:Adenylate kinase family enzyme n=1 Tax=Phytopseudomonas flavescens TaxID=29435 RepID=A0A7Y9XTK1_9GAMM|nr:MULTISPECIES: AAA family ATPase [Pseudomonas]MCW2294677.1 adenylate kinase family enzyme [Pseudomonas sp. BIGb0408]NYH76049.1 adenylate kinase family enzyme [Pseudomonas flavescens]
MEAWVPGRRISVVGCSGAGKTTLSRRLAQRLGYRHVELDGLFHQPGWQPLPTEQFQHAVADALQGDGWVVEGNYSAVRPQILARADTVIWLDLPRAAVMRQLIPRTLRRLTLRQPLWNGNRERWSNLFSLKPEQSILAWAWTRHATYRQRYGEEMRNAPAHRRYLRLDSRQAIERFLSSVPADVPIR